MKIQRKKRNERKTVRILNLHTLAKGNIEKMGGGGTPKKRKELSLEEMEYQSPAKKQKNEFNSSTSLGPNLKPSDLIKNYIQGGNIANSQATI